MHARRLFTALALSATLLVSSLPGIASADTVAKGSERGTATQRTRPEGRAPLADSGIKASSVEAEPDDDISLATRLTGFTGSDTITGHLDSTYEVQDYDDVYAVYLYSGEVLNLSLSGDAETDFGLALFGPAATTVWDAPTLDNVKPYYFGGPASYPAEITSYYIDQDGWYYIDPYTWWDMDEADVEHEGGAGNYTLTVSLNELRPSRVRFNASTTRAYGATATISGEVYDPRFDSDVPTGSVNIYYSYDNVNWIPFENVELIEGQFSSEVLDAYRNTYYFVAYSGDDYRDFSAGTTVVRAYAKLSGVSATRKGTRKYYLYGTLDPAHAAGSSVARIYLWRKVNGSWKSAGYQTATASNYKGSTRFSKTYTFPYKGSWRMRAYHSDGSHAATYGGYSYKTVY